MYGAGILLYTVCLSPKSGNKLIANTTSGTYLVMNRHIRVFSLAIILLFPVIHAVAAGPAVLEVHSTFPRDLAFQGESAHHLNETLQEISSGRLKLEIFGAGEIVPALEVFDAVSANAVAAGWDWIGYWANKVPVTGIIGSMPFGPPPDVYIAWLYAGGGREILQKAYDRHNLWAIPCHMTLQEAGGWFNREINSIEDFRGLKMRISGLGGKILNRVGASTQLIPGGEVYLALERGRIEATEYALPQIDDALGFPRIARYYYFPGWHQPTSLNTLVINRHVWEEYTRQEQLMFETACRVNFLWSYTTGAVPQSDFLAKFEEQGVQIRRFPDEVLDVLREASRAVLEEEAAKDPYFREAYDSIRAFSAKVNRWYEIQEFKR